MGRVIVVQFITIDGVVEDPDGSDGTPFGGWAMRYGPQGVAGDKFRLGPILTDGVLLFGRRTWEHFATRWPARDDPFSRAMNAAHKAVVTHHDVDQAAWSNSQAVPEALVPWVRATRGGTDLVVIGSGSVVRQLEEADLVDEYRLLTLPTVLAAGRRLFPAPRRFALLATEQVGPGTLSRYGTRAEAAQA